MKDLVTILIPTHVLPSAPSTEVIERTLLSLSQIREIYDCRCIIGCDYSTNHQISQHYLHNLCNIKCAFNVEICVIANGQQRANFLNIIKKVTTPYFLFFEHDWSLVEVPPIKKIVKVMEKYKFINTIYFNKRPNLALKYPCGDFILEKENRIKEIPLLKTSKWSNNPNISRTSKWQNEWMKIVERASLNRNNPRKQVEPPLHYLYMSHIEELGFEEAHKLWGMFSYGELGKNKMVIHIDGSRRY